MSGNGWYYTTQTMTTNTSTTWNVSNNYAPSIRMTRWVKDDRGNLKEVVWYA